MKVEQYLKEEIKRLNRLNELLEEQVNENKSNLIIYESVKNNTLAMSEIAKVYRSF